MKSSKKNRTDDFWLRFYFLKYFKYYVLVSFEDSTEITKLSQNKNI